MIRKNIVVLGDKMTGKSSFLNIVRDHQYDYYSRGQWHQLADKTINNQVISLFSNELHDLSQCTALSVTQNQIIDIVLIFCSLDENTQNNIRNWYNYIKPAINEKTLCAIVYIKFNASSNKNCNMIGNSYVFNEMDKLIKIPMYRLAETNHECKDIIINLLNKTINVDQINIPNKGIIDVTTKSVDASSNNEKIMAELNKLSIGLSANDLKLKGLVAFIDSIYNHIGKMPGTFYSEINCDKNLSRININIIVEYFCGKGFECVYNEDNNKIILKW